MSLQNKQLAASPATDLTGKKRGPQNEGKSNDVVENKCRKNVSSQICHDFYENKQVIQF
jgi:hypothetical protein